MVWVDFCGSSEEELHELAMELGLNELAVEDALGPHQHPKLDHYASQRFPAFHAVELNAEDGCRCSSSGCSLSRSDRRVTERAEAGPDEGSAAPPSGLSGRGNGRWRRYASAIGPGLVTGASDDDPSGVAT